MMKSLAPLAFAALTLVGGGAHAQPAQMPDHALKVRTSADILAMSAPSDWQPLAPENTLYLDTAAGRVVIALAPGFAPQHVQNIKTLAYEHYFDGLAVTRVQDNYVVQWGDPTPDGSPRKSLGDAKEKLPAEFTQPYGALPFTKLADGDVYAREVGWSSGFPAARDAKKKQTWLVHCYGMIGAGRDNTPDSSNGSELYAIIGQAPRHLDRNMTIVGRAVWGLDSLSALPRGTGPLGFYEKPEQNLPITAIRLAADMPPEQRTPLELLRTDTPTWTAWVESRRNRRESFFVEPQGHVDLCNVPLPVRKIAASDK
jgi:peptidylprolyl isomerase